VQDRLILIQHGKNNIDAIKKLEQVKTQSLI